MAAFTKFEDSKLEKYIALFSVGEVTFFAPIESGIENSNYFVHTTKDGEDRSYVLTIMESLTFNDLPFFNRVLSHLFNFGVPVPAPQQTLDGMTSTIFCGKPTVLFPKLEGSHLDSADAEHCEQIGKVLAEIHSSLTTKNLHRENPFSVDWMFETIDQIKPLVKERNFELLTRIADEYAEISELPLPKGIIHGDLFRDNALFVNEKLTGVIDFYRACHDFLIQDIAIAINDWCITDAGSIDEALRDGLLRGYESVRTLEDEEREFLPHFQRAASARFALTRMLSSDDGDFLKDPREFLKLAAELFE